MRWDDYVVAYDALLERCNTEAAPWYVVPICERGNARLKGGWRYLRRVTCCPKRITQIARAALVLTQLTHS